MRGRRGGVPTRRRRSSDVIGRVVQQVPRDLAHASPDDVVVAASRDRPR